MVSKPVKIAYPCASKNHWIDIVFKKNKYVKFLRVIQQNHIRIVFNTHFSVQKFWSFYGNDLLRQFY
jgi:hypothetical protein